MPFLISLQPVSTLGNPVSQSTLRNLRVASATLHVFAYSLDGYLIWHLKTVQIQETRRKISLVTIKHGE